MKGFIMSLAMFGCIALWAETEVIDELSLDADATVTVESGATKRIEYLSGTASAMLTKEGAGTLEIAIVGNTNATIRVKAGTLKSVRPNGLSLSEDILFRADAADVEARETATENGTNFVTKIKNADPLMTGMYAVKPTSPNRPNPFLTDNALNGLPVFDFGSFQCSKQSGHGAAMEISEKYIINELLYIWQDYEGVEDIDLNGGSTILGPNPINWRYSYRGYGGGGTDYPMYYTAAGFVTANLKVDGVARAKEFAPGPGWHIVSAHSSTPSTSKVTDYGFYGFGWSPSGSTGYGGFRLAEVIACTNILSVADRAKAVAYLKQKWFGGTPFKRLFVLPDATIDTSETVLRVTTLLAAEGSVLAGGNLLFADSYSSLEFVAASGTVAAKDKAESLTENLAFTGNAAISVQSGTAVVDRVSSASGALSKVGAGTLELAFPDVGVTLLDVAEGTLIVSPLKTSRAYIHVDANAADTMTFSDLNGTNLVTIWNDMNGNGRYLKQSSENYAYGTKGKKKYPYFASDFTNGLSVVDFGTFSSSEFQSGWGAEMNLEPMVRGSESETNSLIYNVFAVWGDRDEVQALPLVDGLAFKGPCLFGNGGAWYRGYGGGGTRFPITSTSSSTMGNSNYINGEFVDYISWMNTYIPPERLFLQNSFVTEGVGVQQIGGNATEVSAIPDNVRGVAGGLRLGELLLFRYRMPTDERFRLDRALRAKWFGDANVCSYDSLSVSAGAAVAFPYADVAITNLTLAGTVSARSLTLPAGGTLTLLGDGSTGFGEISVDSLTLGTVGHVAVPDVMGTTLIGRSFKIASSESIVGRASAWRGCSDDRSMRVVLEKRADGLYARFEGNGMMMIVF